VKFPHNTRSVPNLDSDLLVLTSISWHTQIYYASIGWATAATLGAEVARKELNSAFGRTILVTGEGSMAMTIQEIATMVNLGISPVLIVLNNAGYTVERMIWGATQRQSSKNPS
jgi:pyruvate decarboxylase